MEDIIRNLMIKCLTFYCMVSIPILHASYHAYQGMHHHYAYAAQSIEMLLEYRLLLSCWQFMIENFYLSSGKML